MKNKNIQSPKYDTKYRGKGRLVKKNKVLISVLTTSAFLLPVFSASAESVSTSGGRLNSFPSMNFLDNNNLLTGETTEGNMTIKDNINNPNNAPLLSDDKYYPIRVYSNASGTVMYSIAISRTTKDLKVQIFEKKGTEFEGKESIVIQPGKVGVIRQKEFTLKKSGNFYAFFSKDGEKLHIPYNWNAGLNGKPFDYTTPWGENGARDVNDDSGIYIPGEVKVTANFKDSSGKRMTDVSGAEISEEVYRMYKGQTYTYNIDNVPKIPGYKVKVPDNVSGTPHEQNVNEEKVVFVYEFDKEAHKPEFKLVLEGRNEVNGTGIPGDKIVIKDSKGNKLGEGVVDANSEFKIVTSRPLVKDEILTATPNTGKEEGTSNTVPVQEDIYTKELEKVAAETKKIINDDPLLTTEEKKEQQKAVDKILEKEKENLSKAITEEELSEVVTEGTKNIEQEYKQGKTLDEQQKAAKETLDKVIKETKEAIENDGTLTTAEKETQSKAVDTAGKTAKDVIDATNTADDLKVALETGTSNVKAEHKPGTSVEDQKNQAKESLDKVIKETKKAIENDPTLTNVEKEAQSKAVDEAGTLAKKELEDAANAEDLKTALETGTTNIKVEYKPGTSVEEQKNQARATLDKVIKETKEAIENDPTLTAAEKETQKNAVNETGKAAKETMDKANAAEDLKIATESGTTAVIKEHVPGSGLNVRKETAKDLIDQEVAATKKAIENDPTLTTSEKEKQSEAAVNEGEIAKKAIDVAIDADGINNETAKGIETVANQHKSGDAVDIRKEDAKKAIDEEAKVIKEKITNDPTLTKEEKERQSGKVDQEATTAKKAIDTAKTADGVDEAKGKGIELIDNQYQPGNSLVARKEDAKKVIDQEAKVIKEKITSDPTLTKEEKALQSSKVDEEAKTAKTAIDTATTADGVDEAKGKGIELIDNQYRPGSTLDSRKESAKKAIEQEAILTKEQIMNDPTLTDEEKAEQAGKVDQEAKTAKTAIDTAKTADGVDEAKGKGIELIDNQYQPGNSLVARKEDAKKVIDQEAALIKDRINNDPTLTNEEKVEQAGRVDQEAEHAKANIDTATDASGVDSAKGKGIELINNQYQTGDSLVSRKESAKDAIDREATFTKEQISNDATLTEAEKLNQINGVDQEATTAKAAIDAATNASEVDSAKGKGIELIDNQYQPGISIIDRQNAAKDAIDQEASSTKERITNDPTLTEEEKIEQSNRVDQAAETAKIAIDAATDANGVDGSKGQGVTNIDNQYQTSQPLEERKEAAKVRIDEAASDAKNRITNDPTLTDEEKAIQSAGVDQAAAIAKSEIDAATDASGVDREKGQGITNIDNNYQPGTSLDGRKETAKAGIDQAAQEAKEKIANDPTLTAEEKANQSNGVAEAATKAKEAIDAATDASGVDREKGQGITNIDNNYQPGSGLDTRKDLAKFDIDEAAKATKEKITNDSTLTTEEKAKQSNGVDEAATKAKEAIDAATDANGVDSAKGQGITTIDNNYQPGNPLDLRKETAKAGIDAEAKAIKEKINNDSTLTKEEKAKQSAGVDEAATKAKEAIDTATDASGVDSAKGQGITTINKEYQPGSALDSRKEDAKKAIDNEAKLIKEKINNDSTLTKAEKEKQSKGVDEAATDAKKAIDAAKNADGVDSAKGQGITNVDNNYQPGNQLDGRKEEAKKAIDEAAKATKEKITNDSTLTKAEKEKQSKGVDEAATDAKKAIDAAKNADGVDNAKGQGITSIDKEYKTGNVLDTRKSEAKKAIDEAEKATKAAIAKDSTLTEKEKAAQTKAVETEAKKAKEAIDAAKTADDVDSAKGQGISDITKQHESGKAVESQKEAAKKALDEAAKATKEAISKDSSLTAKEKETQTKAVDKALEEAVKAIDTAKTVDEVNNAKDKGTKEIAKKHVPGKKLETQKEEAKKEIEKVAEKTREAINKDTSLTAKEKAAQIKAVDKALEEAIKAISEAKDADAIEKVKVDAVESVENQHKPGKKIPGKTGGNGINGTNTGGKGTSSGGGYTSGTSGNTGRSTLPKTGSEETGYLAGLIGFALSGLALLGFRKRRNTEEE
ncbi:MULTISPECIES: DUF1542 domain-containing protein [Vagococcus]|uniref:Predicted cell-wall-anchored protein SasC (LPXTG motif) n=1 Tax=Vagococcus fluvialis bH819 TaxID=1255619 RepID=A0A1X6WPE1_9ENTE|nr:MULTISPECIES: DUF1542 domain-containing protein [Vagococcus]SLM86140.1 Predicted cell-wall-anchored protein SasC (LPXTG motif) [Vagococcus fluvialis bH819]HCM90388.1 matrix-binding protein [Vagococcus sp.]